ncbi:MAG TPA: translation initiation factor eIF-1A [Candidatus Thalassarchaeaceae archaeon]|nr:MAG TPA: translation initiation factor eIF-1A [Candidatus Poseidoniales archaeon]HIH84190.1 translation initiation factor eIF-1A [Candidatus Thalassarchaeaceae archaeon]
MESGEGTSRIRVPLPKRKVNEMFAIADQMLGGRRVRAICEDGEVRIARIPGKMRRRQWVREEDLIVVQPWEYQDDRANVITRYSKTQAMYLSRKGQLPSIVDVFGTKDDPVDMGDDSGIFASGDDDDGGLFGDDDDDSLFDSEDSDDVDDTSLSDDDSDEEEVPDEEPEQPSSPEPSKTIDNSDIDDDDDMDIDSFFG